MREIRPPFSNNGSNGHANNGVNGNGHGFNGNHGVGQGLNGSAAPAYGAYGYGGYGYGYAANPAGDFSRTWHSIVEKAWVIALALIVCLGLGYLYTEYAPVLYSATATIQAEQDQPNILKMQMVQIRDLQNVDYLQTVAQSLTSRPLLERVAETNHLWTDPRMVTQKADPVGTRPFLLVADDFRDFHAFLSKLSATNADPVSASLWSHISDLSKQQLRSHDLGDDQKKFVLAGGLNDVLEGAPLDDVARKARVTLSPEVDTLAHSKASKADKFKLNRTVLQEVYPMEIAKIGRARILDTLHKMITVKLRKGTRLIDITVTHQFPELTELIANSIVNEYVNESAEREDTSIGLANKSLGKEAERLRKKLEESESALQAYREKSNASSLDDRENTVVAKLKELSSKATEAKSVRIKTETDYAQVETLGTNSIEALLTVPTVAKDSAVQALQLKLNQAEDDFVALTKRYKQEHPKYIQAQTLIGEIRGDLNTAVLNSVQTLKASLESARAAEQALDKAMKDQEASSLELSKLSIQYSVLTREVESDRALYDAVLKGMKEASVTKETQQTGVIRVVEPAYRPELPIWPKKSATLAASGLGGIFLGLVVIMGLRATDTSIKTVDEAEALLGLSVFSAVPETKGVEKGETRLMMVDSPKSPGAEAFRTLRASVSTLGSAEEWRVVLFTSALPSEGKTFCSTNFAASLAQLGLKTLIIDADMRRPAVEKTLLGKESDTPGLTECLLENKSVLEVARPTKLENLSFLSGGATAANPAEVLAKGGLDAVINEALLHFDRVIVDSAPINAVSDTLLMLKSVQQLCLVVRAAHTSHRYVTRCVQLLQGADAPLSGIILNRMPRRRQFGYRAYYDYQYHGDYGKKGVYGAA